MVDPHESLPPELEARLLALLGRRATREELTALKEAHPKYAAAIDAVADLYRAEEGPDHGPPDYIGPYRIRENIGSGGMGTVYAADQREPVRRRVAIKVVQRGMATRNVLARFALERRALAAMNHRSIAKVFDAGETDRGEPYFVMELVEGLPLTAYCDKHKLGLPERLKLFQQVCSAVQHAHLKGVIHRDLKPGNILVTREGDEAVPKVLDFGLAKATNQDFLEVSLYTARSQVMGTPEYMSPEQAAGDGEAIDARSDIYSLGVLLYEMLTGQLPFSSDALRQLGPLRALQAIQETDPPKPSTRLTTRDASTEELAARRQLSLSALRRVCRGDLDWVVMKALEKSPERRYESATALAAELQRFLDGEPVLAGPPSTGYRLRKLVRRNRAAVAVTSTILVAAFVSVYFAAAKSACSRLLSEKIFAQQSAETARAQAAKEAQRALAQEELAEQRAEDLAVTNRSLEAKTQEAEANAAAAAANAAKFRARTEEFNQIAGVILHERAVAEASELFPAWPENLSAMEEWLSQDIQTLAELRPSIEETIQTLVQRALPRTEEERVADRESHPRYAEWQRRTAQLATLQAAASVRAGGDAPQAELPEELRSAGSAALNRFAWPRVAPAEDGRERFGEEVLALAAAEAAVSKAREVGDEDLHQYLDTLAWARFAAGLDEAAMTAMRQALATAPDADKENYAEYLSMLSGEITEAAQKLEKLRAEVASLEQELARRRTWRFEAEEDAFLFRTLTGLLGDLEELEGGLVAEVAEIRLSWARYLLRLESSDSWKLAWRAASSAVASSTKYAESPVPALEPQRGLWPIGENPVSGLYEFYHLRSAWDGESDPASIEIPRHDRGTGHIDVREGTGVIFVLIPGGATRLGAQADAPDLPFFDPAAQPIEQPVHELVLRPFLLAAHELTQGQWSRIVHEGQEGLPSRYAAGFTVGGMASPVDMRHPVEQVDWNSCVQLLNQHALVLPTEAQWEHACRAGMTTPWAFGQSVESLDSTCNLLDQRAKQMAPWTGEAVAWDDGFVIHAPVGSFRPNAFGLYDMHGNVYEWCRDSQGAYTARRSASDGLMLGSSAETGFRAIRGGSYLNSADRSRSAARQFSAPSYRGVETGVRVARTLL